MRAVHFVHLSGISTLVKNQSENIFRDTKFNRIFFFLSERLFPKGYEQIKERYMRE